MCRKSFSFAFMVLFAVGFIFVFGSCSRVPGSSKAAVQAQREKAFYLFDSFRSSALSRDTLKQNPARPISVMLPPSYYDNAERRYPVLYFLHGYKEVPGMIAVYRNIILKLMAAGTIPEMIVVEPDCTTKYGGGYYVNSPVTGDYEDYLTKELVAFIDANYRTMPVASARGLSGFSMGGYGALTQGMRHPDIFGVVYAIAPAILAPGGLLDAWANWSKISDQLNALASAFSPVSSGDKPGRIPTLDGSPDDDAVCALWYAGLGDWDKKVSAYLGLPERLRGLRITCNSQDTYGHIRAGSEYLHAQLTERGVPHEFEVSNSPGHGLTLSIIVDDLLPYMGKTLSRAE